MPHTRTIRLSGRPYRRRLARPLQTARGGWSIREGWLLKWEDLESGSKGFGEVAPLPEFGSETLAEAEAFIRSACGELPEEAWREALASAPAATAFGLWSAAFDASPQSGAAQTPVAGLLSIGPNATAEVRRLREAGLKTFKVKVGRHPPEAEWNWLIAVIRTLSPTEKLRLDPNQSWDQEAWHYWEHHLGLFKGSIEFIEEPFPADTAPSEQLRLAGKSLVPLALDESLRRDGIKAWDRLHWPGYWIIKPSLFGLPDHWLATLATRADKVVLSSAFETGIGMTSLARLAGPFNSVDHGFGTQDWFEDPWRAPQAAGSLRSLDTDEMENIWRTLPKS